MVYVSLTIISKQTAILIRTISSKCRNFENGYNSRIADVEQTPSSKKADMQICKQMIQMLQAGESKFLSL